MTLRAIGTIAAATLLLSVIILPAIADTPVAPDELPSTVARLPPLDPAFARVFFIRKGKFIGSATTARIRLNGETVAWLSAGKTVFVDHAPGEVTVGVDTPMDFFGQLDFPVKLQAGQYHYVVVMARSTGCYGGVGVVFCINDASEKEEYQYCDTGWCTKTIEASEALPILAKMTILSSNPKQGWFQ